VTIELELINENIKLLTFDCNDIIIINSSNLQISDDFDIQNICSQKNIVYTEIENDPTYDFGKWIYALKRYNLISYDYIIFTNDSFKIHKTIDHFYNLIAKNNMELYGYNDSTELKYHYQSYLFSLRVDMIQKFIEIFESKKDKIKNQEDIIFEFEINLTDFFNNHDCFLKIGNTYNKQKNIYFKNDEVYIQLFHNNLLPFTKLKRDSRELLNILNI
jgi:hypothetical protein